MHAIERRHRAGPASPLRRGCAVALAAVLLAGASPAARAACADGTTFPAGGYAFGQPPASSWSPSVFTETHGSIFIPDASTFEHNDPAQPLTGGGHDWVFDQGTTLCKQIDVGPAAGAPTSWAIPPVTSSADCIVLPVIQGGVIKRLGDVPYQGDVLTPTCDPTLLSPPGAPNPANTYLNQLGCSISHGVATTPQTATSFLFVTGVNGGLFAIPLKNVANPAVGGPAGKVAGPIGLASYYSHIPEGQKLTNANVSKDGQFAIATSKNNLNTIFACLNPLGDPGDPRLPIDPSFTVPPASTVLCMGIGNNNVQTDLSNAFGPDNQPYFGGRRGVNVFGPGPGGTANNAWPQCIWKNNGSTSLLDAFAHNRAGGCGNGVADFAFSSAGLASVNAMIAHGQYVYAAPNIAGPVVQFKVTVDPITGFSQATFRTYLGGAANVTGLGVADDLGSLLVFSDPSGVGVAGAEVVSRLPLCEDM